jgi:hypothetical protein
LVAEEVAQVDLDLVARDEEGKPYTVRYEPVNVMLLNEFLKAHQRIDELSSKMKNRSPVRKLKSEMGQQQKEVRNLTATLKEQAAQLQQVTSQFKQTSVPRIIADSNRPYPTDGQSGQPQVDAREVLSKPARCGWDR